VVKRVYEAVYAKVLVPDDELLRPDPKNLWPPVLQSAAYCPSTWGICREERILHVRRSQIHRLERAEAA
jgi:hypothetical protein